MRKKKQNIILSQFLLSNLEYILSRRKIVTILEGDNYMKHEMKLNNEPFMKIKDGRKTIELRLNDEKRQLLKINDYIEFTNRDNEEKILVEVEDLYHYPSFKELYKSLDKSSLGYNEDEEAKPSDMDKYYSKEEQDKYGVLGIKVKIIK